MFARVSVWGQVDLANFERAQEWFNDEGVRLSQELLPGYKGGMTVLDREAGTVVGIGLYDDEASVREADRILESGFPDGMPDDVKEILSRAVRSSKAIGEVVQADGALIAGVRS